jgi:hypothetical protein
MKKYIVLIIAIVFSTGAFAQGTFVTLTVQATPAVDTDKLSDEVPIGSLQLAEVNILPEAPQFKG